MEQKHDGRLLLGPKKERDWQSLTKSKKNENFCFEINVSHNFLLLCNDTHCKFATFIGCYAV